MSVKKDIFKTVGDYLMSVLQNNDPDNFPKGLFTPDMNLKGLQWFDKQMGQFNNPELALAIPLPCILMEYQTFAWQTIGKNQQKGNGSIRFYIYFENYADAFTGSVNQELALQFFEFTEQVNIALQGYYIAQQMAPLQRVSDNEDSAEDMIITSMVDYGTIVSDISTAEAKDFTMVDANVTVEKVSTVSRPARGGFIDGFILPVK